MARLSEQIKVKVGDRSGVEGGRKFALEVDASDDLFHLSDALMRDEVVSVLGTELRFVIRSGVQSYLQKSRQLIRKLGKKGKQSERISNE